MTDDMRKVVEIVFVPIIRNVDSRRHQLSHLHPKVRRIVSNTICDLLEDVVIGRSKTWDCFPADIVCIVDVVVERERGSVER
jgi:hypothetical protein